MIETPPLAFISHVDREDWLRRVAQRVSDELHGKGFDVYLARANPSPGTRFDDRVYPNIERSDAFIVLWTAEAPDSSWVVEEYRFARRIRRRVGLVREDGVRLPDDWDPKHEEYIPLRGFALRPNLPLLFPAPLEPGFSEMVGLIATTVIQGAIAKRGHNPMWVTPRSW
jgi:hypothetical protein